MISSTLPYHWQYLQHLDNPTSLASSYCLAIVNTLVSFGLFLLYTSPYKSFNWNPPFRAPKLVISIFFLSNVFLVLVPFVPPGPDSKTYEHLPYWVSLRPFRGVFDT